MSIILNPSNSVESSYSDFLIQEFVTEPDGSYASAVSLVINTLVSIPPTSTSGTGWGNKLVSLSIVDGTLPVGITLNVDKESSEWGNLEGTPTVASTGSCTIRMGNPKGYNDYILNWTVA